MKNCKVLSMNEAPSEKAVLLLLPEFSIFIETWWVGKWSWVKNRWELITPFVVDGKMMVVDGIPEPKGWQWLPEVSNKNKRR